jgi:hypothetical protein
VQRTTAATAGQAARIEVPRLHIPGHLPDRTKQVEAAPIRPANADESMNRLSTAVECRFIGHVQDERRGTYAKRSN